MNKNLLFVAVFFSFLLNLNAQNGQCPTGKRRVTVHVTPDNNPQQTTWSLVSKGGEVLLSGGANSDSVCVRADSCVRFTIRDSGGNGLCCSTGIGQYKVWYDGLLVRSNYNFGLAETMWMGCKTTTPEPGQRQIRVYINPDRFPSETSWNLMNGEGDTLSKGRTFGDTLNVSASGCLRFKIMDTYGDGMCCQFGQGDYRVFSNDSLLFSGGQFTFSDSRTESCQPGYDCSSAIEASTDTFTTFYDNSWYRFIPDSTGRYLISTCNLANSCSTKIWVYDYCNNLQPSEGNAATLAYAVGGCGQQALLSMILEKNFTYYIRIGDDMDNCNPDPVKWALSFSGPIVGCMDPASCNFNPLATVQDSSSCLYNPDTACPEQPDLVVLSDLLRTSFKFDSLVNNDACYIQEGCLKGMGKRYIIRFSTRIENIGDADYYIGKPPASPATPSSQWIWDPCHGHWHYIGYAEYLLFDQQSNPIPAGFKAGFCVMDLNCSIGGGIPKYNCSNQGVTAGCGDIYDRNLKCQWIDITDVDTGSYIFVARVNWDNSPDKLGRIESNMFNNWGQFCLKISKNSSGRLFANLLTECNPYVDCQGQVFGSALRDCKGICQGTALQGDVNNDGLRNQADLNAYLEGVLSGSLVSSPCLDLSGDSSLNATDIALMMQCLGAEDSASQVENCHFEPLFYNSSSMVKLGIDTINAVEGFADLTILNPQDEVSAFQFSISGIVPDSVRLLNFADSGEVHLTSRPDGKILAAMQGNRIARHAQPISFLRVFFSSTSGPQVCIQNFESAMSPGRHLLASQTGPCKIISQVTRIPSRQGKASCRVIPNPFRSETTLYFPNQGSFNLSIFDAQGKRVFIEKDIRQSFFRLKAESLIPGIYHFLLSGAEQFSGTLVIEK
jgi:hypothetical protein